MRSMFSFCFSLTHLSHRMINKENQRFWDRTVITRLDLNGLGGGGGVEILSDSVEMIIRRGKPKRPGK